MSAFSVQGGPVVGEVETIVTSGRGLNPDELTRMLLPKILHVSDDLAPDARQQAEEGRARLEVLLRHYFVQAQRSQNTSIFNVLMNAGHESAAELVRSL